MDGSEILSTAPGAVLWFAVPMVVCNCPQFGVELAVAMLPGVERMKHFCALESWMWINLWNSML